MGNIKFQKNFKISIGWTLWKESHDFDDPILLKVVNSTKYFELLIGENIFMYKVFWIGFVKFYTIVEIPGSTTWRWKFEKEQTVLRNWKWLQQVAVSTPADAVSFIVKSEILFLWY